MNIAVNHVLTGLLFLFFAMAMAWSVRRWYVRWRRTGRLYVRPPGMTLRSPWAVYPWLIFGVMLSIVGFIDSADCFISGHTIQVTRH